MGISQILFYLDSLPIYEIVNLDHQLDLAVLSVCNANAGRLRAGEGVISLSRAFIQSGCPSVTSSMWQADDEKSLELMKNYYLNLKNGQAKNKALSESQRSYLESSSDKSVLEMHPYYWATFIHSGDVVPIFDAPFWERIPFSTFFILIFLTLLLIIRFLSNRKTRKKIEL